MIFKIKLQKLKTIVEKITSRKVNITYTTMFEQGDNRKAVVTFNNIEANIVINSSNIKSVEDIIDAVAHETAHIILGTNEHSKRFLAKWNELFAEIKSKYSYVKKIVV